MTIKDHLKHQLVPQVYELAIENCRKQKRMQVLEYDINSSKFLNKKTIKGDCLIMAFNWKHSQEGAKFWTEIYRNLKLDY